MEYNPSFIDQLDENYISHHGILGQKWGIRRYQNPDGSLTPAGKRRYRNSLTVINNTKSSLKELRDQGAYNYALNQNNYEVTKKGVDDGIAEGWTLEEQNKRYPYMLRSMEHERRLAQYYKSQVEIVDIMNKKISDIDVTSQSFKDTVKLVNDILDNGAVSMEKVRDEYRKSPEYKNYQQMQKEVHSAMKKTSSDHRRQILDEYKI